MESNRLYERKCSQTSMMGSAADEEGRFEAGLAGYHHAPKALWCCLICGYDADLMSDTLWRVVVSLMYVV